MNDMDFEYIFDMLCEDGFTKDEASEIVYRMVKKDNK